MIKQDISHLRRSTVRPLTMECQFRPNYFIGVAIEGRKDSNPHPRKRHNVAVPVYGLSTIKHKKHMPMQHL